MLYVAVPLSPSAEALSERTMEPEVSGEEAAVEGDLYEVRSAHTHRGCQPCALCWLTASAQRRLLLPPIRTITRRLQPHLRCRLARAG